MPMCDEALPASPQLAYLPDVQATYDPARPLIAEIGASVLRRLQWLGRHKTARAFAAAWRAAPDLQAALDLAERLQVLPEPAAALAGRCQSLRQIYLSAKGTLWHLYTHERNELDEQEWMLLIAGCGQPEQALGHLPAAQRTERLCRLALSIDGNSLCQVPVEMRSLEICEMAIRNGSAIVLHYVPVNLLRSHPHLWEMALSRSAEAFCSLPHELKTQARLRELIPLAPALIENLEDKVEKVDAARQALECYGAALLHIPPKQRTREDCRRALASGAPQVPSAVDTTHGWDEELVQVAVLANAAALDVVPPNLVTPELLQQAARQPNFCLDQVPAQRRTKTLCRLAVEQNPENLAHVPKRHLDIAMVVLAIRRGGPWQALSSESLAHPQIQEALLEHARWAWTSFARTEAHWARVLKNSPQALLECYAHIPESLRTAEAYDAAVRGPLHQDEFGKMPSAQRTASRCALALQNGAAWKEVPALLRYLDKRS